MVEKRTAYRILVGKTEGKRPLGRPKRRWVDNIKMDLREIGYGPVEDSCEHGNEPSGSIKRWEVLEGLYNRLLLKKGSAPYCSLQGSLSASNLPTCSMPCSVLEVAHLLASETHLSDQTGKSLIHVISLWWLTVHNGLIQYLYLYILAEE
jgi:hypothetical protein